MVSKRFPVLALTERHGSTVKAAILVACLFSFLALPAFTLLLSMLVVWNHQAASNRGTYGVAVLCSLYFGLINVTKTPESDLAVYLDAFSNARALDLASFLLLNTREPLYYIALYGFANLPGTDGHLYVFISTVAEYLFVGVALLRLGEALQLQRRVLLSLLIGILFLPQLFSLSAHLMRQFLASALVMLFLSEKAISGRRHWTLGISAVMIHYSSLPLFLISLLPPLRRYSSMTSVLFSASALLAAYGIAMQVAPILLDIPIAGIIFQRMTASEGAEMQPIGYAAALITALALGLALVSLSRMKVQQSMPSQWSISLATVTICILVLVSSAYTSLSELALRYFFYLYFLIGLLLPFLIKKKYLIGVATHALALLSVPTFFYKIATSEWTYAPVITLLAEPSWMLWNHNLTAVAQ